MFDPEKVKTWAYHGGDQMVLKEEYDQLLELYRQSLANREAYAKGMMTMRQPAEV